MKANDRKFIAQYVGYSKHWDHWCFAIENGASAEISEFCMMIADDSVWGSDPPADIAARVPPNFEMFMATGFLRDIMLLERHFDVRGIDPFKLGLL